MKEGKKSLVKIGSGLPVINPNAAGIDIGDTLHCIAINTPEGVVVQTTTAFTCDLVGIVEFLRSHNITTVAMESTGVYWLALYIMLEEAGIEPYLVNASHVKNVTGRKKDDTDSVWILKLHTCGLLQKSFQPDHETRKLRDYVRHRAKLITLGADAVRRMQKALEQMNIKIHTVISDILGKTGMSIVKAILGGERNAETLSKLRGGGIKASEEDIIKSLQGIWKEEQLFMLKQAVEDYEFRQKQIKECEEVIEKQLIENVAAIQNGDISNIEEKKQVKKEKNVKPKKNQFNSSIKDYLKIMANVDLCLIPGISEISALSLISEIGTNMKKWKSSKHFAAWLNIAPNTKISGGKTLSSKMMKKKNVVGQILKQAASCLSTNKTPLGDYYRKKRSKLGGKGAVLATAHKIARIIYNMISKKVEFSLEMLSNQENNLNENRIKKLEKQLEQLKKQQNKVG